MLKYVTTHRWLDNATGRTVDPPTLVELPEERGQRLCDAGCLRPARPEDLPKLEPPKGAEGGAAGSEGEKSDDKNPDESPGSTPEDQEQPSKGKKPGKGK